MGFAVGCVVEAVLAVLGMCLRGGRTFVLPGLVFPLPVVEAGGAVVEPFVEPLSPLIGSSFGLPPPVGLAGCVVGCCCCPGKPTPGGQPGIDVGRPGGSWNGFVLGMMKGGGVVVVAVGFVPVGLFVATGVVVVVVAVG